MRSTSPFKDQLSEYRKTYLQQPNSPSVRFGQLRNLYGSYVQQAHDLSLMTYGTSLIDTERNYGKAKDSCKAEHQQLKQLQKDLDDRTLAIEQQLYLGLPDDLKEMEKVINEQESILADQQKINQLEEQLLEKMRKIDIEHGKKLATIEQAAMDRTAPIKADQQAFFNKIDLEEKQTAKKTKFFTLLPIIIIPIAIDVLAQVSGIQKATADHLIFSHYFFLISFILIQVFFASKIKHNIATKLSASSCSMLFAELETTWAANQNQMKKLQSEYNIDLAEVKSLLGSK